MQQKKIVNGKATIVAIGVFASLVMSAMGAASNKPPQDGPYKDYCYVKTDKSMVANNQTSGGVWIGVDDSKWPTNGYSYYVGPALLYRIMNTSFHPSKTQTFQGDRLVLAGSIQYEGTTSYPYNLVITNLTLLPGSVFRWHLSNNGSVSDGDWEVKGAVDNPSRIQPPSTKAYVRTLSFLPTFRGDATAYLRYEMTNETYNGHYFGLTTSYPNYNGTIEFGAKSSFYADTFSVPGTVVVTNGATLRLDSASGTSSFGTLIVRAGGTLKFNTAKNTHVIKIENQLVLEPGAKLVHNKEMGGTDVGERPGPWPLFDLSATAYAAGLPNFDKVTMSGSCTNTDYNLPSTRVIVVDGENGRKTVQVQAREIVYQIKGGYGIINNSYWSDGLGVSASDVAEKDFYSKVSNYIYGYNVMQYVFPGASYTHTGTYLYLFSTNLQFKTLRIGGGSTWKLYSYPKYTYDLIADVLDVYEGKVFFYLADGNLLRIPGPISGTGTISFKTTFQEKINWTTVTAAKYATYFSGSVKLSGDNSDYDGAIRVSTLQSASTDVAGYFERVGLPAYAPSAVSNMTLIVSSSKNLGGQTTSFAYDAIQVENQSRLELSETATFDDLNRGWYFPAVGYIRVPSGKTATVETPISYETDTRLVKEGAGTLALAGAPNIRTAGGTFTVSEGGVKPTVANAFAGLAVTVGQSGKLVFDASSPVTVDLTSADTSLAGGEGHVEVEILDTETPRSTTSVSATLFTVPAASAAALVGQLNGHVTARMKDGSRRCKVTAVDTDDSNVKSIVADYSNPGLMIIIK